MDNYFLRCEKTKTEYLNDLIKIMTNIKQAKKDKNISCEIAKTLISYKMADLGLDKIKLKLLDKNCGYIGSQNNDVISINEKLIKFNLKNLVVLMDCLLHEFDHIKTDLSNKEIKKDEFGTPNNKYIPKFYEQFVYLALHLICNLELEDASELSVALYAFDQNEMQANKYAFVETINILEACKNQANKKFIDKMIAIEKHNYLKFIATHQTQRNKMLIEQFNFHCKPNLLAFQLEFAKKPINTPLDLSKIYVVRMLCPSDEADQKLFEHFLKLGNVNACIKIMNAPDFKNTPKNLKDLIALMQKSNVDLSNLTGIDKNALLRMLNYNDDGKNGFKTQRENNKTENLTINKSI